MHHFSHHFVAIASTQRAIPLALRFSRNLHAFEMEPLVLAVVIVARDHTAIGYLSTRAVRLFSDIASAIIRLAAIKVRIGRGRWRGRGGRRRCGRGARGRDCRYDGCGAVLGAVLEARVGFFRRVLVVVGRAVLVARARLPALVVVVLARVQLVVAVRVRRWVGRTGGGRGRRVVAVVARALVVNWLLLLGAAAQWGLWWAREWQLAFRSA